MINRRFCKHWKNNYVSGSLSFFFQMNSTFHICSSICSYCKQHLSQLWNSFLHKLMKSISNIAHVYYFYTGLSSFLLSCNDFSLQTNERCCELHKNVDENAAGCCPVALLSFLIPYFLSKYGSFFLQVALLFWSFSQYSRSSIVAAWSCNSSGEMLLQTAVSVVSMYMLLTLAYPPNKTHSHFIMLWVSFLNFWESAEVAGDHSGIKCTSCPLSPIVCDGWEPQELQLSILPSTLCAFSYP